MVDCPKCKVEMTSKPARIPLFHYASQKKNKNKTKIGYVYECPKCEKLFIVTTMLKEVSKDEIKDI